MKIYLIAVLFISVGLFSGGCYYSSTIPVQDNVKIDSTIEPYKVETLDGKTIDFRSDPDGHAYLKDSMVVRILSGGSTESIPVSDIKKLYIRHYNVALTLVLVAASSSMVLLGLFIAFYPGPGG